MLDADGHELTISAKKNRALLAILALSPGLSSSRERLAGLLWSDRQDEQARSSLRQALAVVRRELGDTDENILQAKDDVVRLNPEGVIIDAVEFHRLAKSSEVDYLRQAAVLYRGELLEDFGGREEGLENWLTFERARLRQETVKLLERLVALETGTAAMPLAQKLVALDPLREASHRALMEAQARSGERGAALKQFEELKLLLRTELDIEPSAETQALASSLSKTDASAAATTSHKRPRNPIALKPTLAVLPFRNLSSDASQDFLSDGITDDIITELSRFRNLQVFARRTSFALRDSATSAGSAGQELGATYVLEGSVRTHGTRVRVNVQLSQTETGEQVWAERYDRDQIDILALQEEVARTIAGTLAIELDDREFQQSRSKHLDDFRAYEFWLKGKRILWTEGASNLLAREQFQRAVELDPGFSRAYAGLGVTFVEEAVQFPPMDEFDRALALGREVSQKAVDLDAGECLGHASLAWSLLYLRDYERCYKHVTTALKLNPNDADMLANAAYVLAMYGDAEDAVKAGKAAMRLNPRHPEWYLGFMGTAFFAARRYAEGIEVRSRAPDTFYDSRFFGASMLARLGRIDEANQWAEIGLAKLKGRVGDSRFSGTGAVRLLLDNNPFRTEADQSHFAESLRMAGVPG